MKKKRKRKTKRRTIRNPSFRNSKFRSIASLNNNRISQSKCMPSRGCSGSSAQSIIEWALLRIRPNANWKKPLEC
jgi:hypothetical protein